MKRYGLVLGLGLLAAVPLSRAEAASAPALPTGGIELIAQGCGPGGHRDRFGYCRPNYAPPPRYRGCPPAYHPTPYGCRRNY